MTARVTIAVVPRERFSESRASLARIYEVTDSPFELVYVDGKSPRRVRNWLRHASEELGFTLVREERYLSPNEARNIALAHVTTPYVLFVDNDLFVEPGWLETLLECAENTGAWAVGPLYFEGDPKDEVIHMAGGDMEFTGSPGSRGFDTVHRLQKERLGDVPELRREPVGFVEFHCALVRTDVFDVVGPLDEALRSTREHLDLCLQIHEHGGSVWFEPAAHVTYLAPPPIALRDVPYFWLRWSEAWSEASLAHFCRKYEIDGGYAERIWKMRARRQIVFAPVRRVVRRLFGAGAAKRVTGWLERLETHLNRAFVRPLDESSVETRRRAEAA